MRCLNFFMIFGKHGEEYYRNKINGQYGVHFVEEGL